MTALEPLLCDLCPLAAARQRLALATAAQPRLGRRSAVAPTPLDLVELVGLHHRQLEQQQLATLCCRIARGVTDADRARCTHGAGVVDAEVERILRENPTRSVQQVHEHLDFAGIYVSRPDAYKAAYAVKESPQFKSWQSEQVPPRPDIEELLCATAAPRNAATAVAVDHMAHKFKEMESTWAGLSALGATFDELRPLQAEIEYARHRLAALQAGTGTAGPAAVSALISLLKPYCAATVGVFNKSTSTSTLLAST
eukprot:SAG31_NODE_352_length_17229_cov_9.658669_3_plen_255_part_00